MGFFPPLRIPLNMSKYTDTLTICRLIINSNKSSEVNSLPFYSVLLISNLSINLRWVTCPPCCSTRCSGWLRPRRSVRLPGEKKCNKKEQPILLISNILSGRFGRPSPWSREIISSRTCVSHQGEGRSGDSHITSTAVIMWAAARSRCLDRSPLWSWSLSGWTWPKVFPGFKGPAYAELIGPACVTVHPLLLWLCVTSHSVWG